MAQSKNLIMTDQPLEVTPPTERAVEYTIYKPNSRGSGGVVRFGLNRAKACLFVDATNQSGEKQFDWENKITMKWALSDLGTVLAALQGQMPQAKLFHQSERANSAFELTRQEDPDRAPYILMISRQNAADKSLRKVMLPLSHGEAAVLETALQTAIARLLNW
jgi:Whirly transcription factor